MDLVLVRRLNFEIPRILPDVASSSVSFFGVLFILQTERACQRWGATTAILREVGAAFQEAASQTKGILSQPPPQTRIVGYGDSAVTYDVRYWIDDYTHDPDIMSALMIRIWYVFARRGIEIPDPIRNVFHHEVSGDTRGEVDERAGTSAVPAPPLRAVRQPR